MKGIRRCRDAWPVIAVLFLAAGVYLWHLSSKSLWLDEAVSLALVQPRPGDRFALSDDVHPPLYFALLGVFVKAFGTSESALRLLSAVSGVLAVALIGWVASYDTRPGVARWVPMALMTLCPMPVQYAQTARGYMLLAALTIASYGCLLRWERRQRMVDALSYVAATLAMCYTHYFGFLAFATQQVYIAAAIWRRRMPRMSLALGALVIIGYLPWFGIALGQFRNIERTGFWLSSPPTLSNLAAFAAGAVIELGPRRWLAADMLIAGYAGLALIGLVGWPAIASFRPGRIRHSGATALSSRSATWSGVLLLMWLSVPIVVTFVCSWIWRPVFLDRYLIGSIPAFYLLIGRGVAALPTRWLRAAAIMFMFAAGAVNLRAYYPGSYEDWRGLADRVQRDERPGDVLLITPLYLSEPFAYYYRGSLTVSSWNPGEQAHSFERAAQAEARRGRIWHISHGPVDLPQSMAGGRIEKWEFSQTESSVTLYLRDFGADVGTTLPAPASAMRDR